MIHKDSYVLRKVRNEYGKEIRKAYEAHEVSEKRGNMTILEPRTDGISNTITTVQKDNYVLEVMNMSKEFVRIKQATKKGYIECEVGGVADFSYPNSENRRGRVQGGGQICPTITAESIGICKIESVRGGGTALCEKIKIRITRLCGAVCRNTNTQEMTEYLRHLRRRWVWAEE